MPTPIAPTAIYKPQEAADLVGLDRSRIDGACKSGALLAADATPKSSKRSWRILGSDLIEWVRRSFPDEPPAF